MIITKAITICQPYAHLICVTGEKLTENRTWYTNYRGSLAIHAGKSREWLTVNQERDPDPEGMVFGAIIGVVDVIDCIKLDNPTAHRKYPWLKHHDHASGPFCMVLANRKRLITPLPWKGALGLWRLPDDFSIPESGMEPTPPCVFGTDLAAPGANPTPGVQ